MPRQGRRNASRVLSGCWALGAAILLVPSASAEAADADAQRKALADAVARSETLWRRVETDEIRPTCSSRSLLGYALLLAEARVHPERIERLLERTRQMQDQDPKSKTWGNFRWYWRDAAVTDINAVEFCIYDALLIELRHRDWLSCGAGKHLTELLRLGLEGCLRHRVPTDYTNIAILNAGNLIVLGERLGRPDAARDGYRRLDGLCAWTAALGIHEFCSPTYYGIDLNGLLLIRTHAQHERQRRQAAAMLDLFAADIAANWLPNTQRLGGCHSRSYDYRRGLGALDWYLWVSGRIDTAGSAERREPWAEAIRPPATLSGKWPQHPRLVRQHWGTAPAESRTHAVYKDIALSCCSAGYGNQDSTLVVDLPGGRSEPRCYFIPDGREDPYGEKKFEAGSGRHAKALHLRPFWAGAQRGGDAMGLVIYDKGDLSAQESVRIQSHFVVRRTEQVWLDGKAFHWPAEKCVELPPGRSLVLRYAGAAVGVRVPWTRLPDGNPARVTLVDDSAAAGCFRITVEHGARGTLESLLAGGSWTGAAYWVRVGSGLASDADFHAWRREFEAARPGAASATGQRVEIEVPGKDGPLKIDARASAARWGRVRIVPQPYQGVLEVDGREVGLPLLTAVEPLSSMPANAGPLHATKVTGDKAAYWEAESGLIVPGLSNGTNPDASGGRYIGQEPAPLSQPGGIAVWNLSIEKPGRYWLWARLRSSGGRGGAFSFQASDDEGAILPTATWSPRLQPSWQWLPLKFDGAASSAPLDLSRGLCRIQLQVRRSGVLIDRLMLTPDPNGRP